MSLFDSFRNSFIQLSSAAKIILLILIVLALALVGSFIAMALAVMLYHCDINTLSRIIRNPDEAHVHIIKFFQIFQSVTLFIIPALVASWLFSKNAPGYLKVNTQTSAFTVLLVFLSVFAAIPLLNIVTSFNARLDLPDSWQVLENEMKAMEESAGRLTELFLKSNSTADLLINFLMIAILPAIGEELFFRGVVQRLLIELTKNEHIGIFIAAFVFSFIHFQFYGFLPRFLLGLYFGYLFIWSGTIWIPIAAHLANNGIAVFYYHFASKPVGQTALDTVGTTDDPGYLLYISVFTTCILIGMIYLREKNNRSAL